jgi:hypothetical protein
MDDWIKRMVECLAPAEVGDVRVEEAIAIKYQHRSKSVFKYRCNDQRSRDNLEKDLVWICSPTSYNDPYDSSLSITAQILTNTVILEGVREIINRELASRVAPEKIDKILHASHPALALQELIMVDMDEAPPEHRTKFQDDLTAQMRTWEEAFAKTLPGSHKHSLKVCSFSATQFSIIMWSHYSNHHRGFCIEYDTASLPSEHLFASMLYPVIYSERLFDGTNYYLAAIRNQKTFNILFPALAALYKSPEWSYEKEWRLVIPANLVPEASPWGVPTPKSVYLGSRMPEEDKQPILEICRRKGIDVHQMYLADDSFRLHSKLVVSAGS